jgi:hypothetical protein
MGRKRQIKGRGRLIVSQNKDNPSNVFAEWIVFAHHQRLSPQARTLMIIDLSYICVNDNSESNIQAI